MTTYAASIDQTEESANGCKFSAIAGTGGTTAGYPVKYDGSTAKTVVMCTTDEDIAIGLAATTQLIGEPVTVLSNGCKVLTPFTLTVGGRVGMSDDATAQLENFDDGTTIGICETGATTASVVRIQIQY
ncbi:Uncharacterised protein [Candidatus Anstonella stagnisolia]|nr:Uncharacterised protein [Candidatus Anstonella stagnisolia]